MVFPPFSACARALLWTGVAALVVLAGARSASALPPADDLPGLFSVYDRMLQYDYPASRRLAPYFRAADVDYPPHTVLLVAFKSRMRLELYAGNSPDALKYIRYYRVLGASGTMGPKLREGDRQVPEGIYRFTHLNPNSAFHLSLKVDYPNAFDRMMGHIDDRRNLGGGIFIHGGSESAGCLAMSNPVVEEIFTLVAHSGIENASIIMAPVDLRHEQAPNPLLYDIPVWTPHLYTIIQRALWALPPTRDEPEWEEYWAQSNPPIE